MDILEVLKLLSDYSRIRILNILHRKDLCVCEIVYLLGLTQSNASRHLNNMIQMNILENYKVNKYTFYRLRKDILFKFSFVEEILEKEVMTSELLLEDLRKLNAYMESGKNHVDICATTIEIQR